MDRKEAVGTGMNAETDRLKEGMDTVTVNLGLRVQRFGIAITGQATLEKRWCRILSDQHTGDNRRSNVDGGGREYARASGGASERGMSSEIEGREQQVQAHDQGKPGGGSVSSIQ